MRATVLTLIGVGMLTTQPANYQGSGVRAASQEQCPAVPSALDDLPTEEALDSLQFAIDAGRAVDDQDSRKCWYRVAERIARQEALDAPQSLDAQYRFALALGLRADVEGGRTRVGLADELYRQLQVVLEMDPENADAQHIFGRLHAGVMRMNRVTRFVATRVLGGDALKAASWEEAEALLVFAELARPEVPDYHYELGRLYEDTDRPDDAIGEAQHVLDLEPQNAGGEVVRKQAEDLMERMAEEAGGR